MSHRPLSQELGELLAHPDEKRGLTVNQLIEKTQGRGVYLVIVVLNIPFITPVPVWGLSTIFGTIIALLGTRMLSQRPPMLPAFFGDREIPPVLRRFIGGGGVRLLQWIERVVRPRRSQWMSWRAVQYFNAGLVIFMALLLALPLPIVLTNSFPALTTILIAVSMMEEDGVTIFFGYAMVVATLVYFGLWAGAIVAALVKLVETLRHYLTGT